MSNIFTYVFYTHTHPHTYIYKGRESGTYNGEKTATTVEADFFALATIAIA